MRDISVKKTVAKSFNLPQYKYMESWMRSISVLRNYCAHHARLWNRRFPMIPKLPKRLSLDWIDIQQTKPIKIFSLLSILLYLEQSISPKVLVKEHLLELFTNQPLKRMKAMGVPDNWASLDLWR